MTREEAIELIRSALVEAFVAETDTPPEMAELLRLIVQPKTKKKR